MDRCVYMDPARGLKHNAVVIIIIMICSGTLYVVNTVTVLQKIRYAI